MGRTSSYLAPEGQGNDVGLNKEINGSCGIECVSIFEDGVPT